MYPGIENIDMQIERSTSFHQQNKYWVTPLDHNCVVPHFDSEHDKKPLPPIADDNFYNTRNLLDVHVDNDNFNNNLRDVDDDNFNSNSGDVADDKDECDEVEKNVTSEGKKITKKKEKKAKPVLKACC